MAQRIEQFNVGKPYPDLPKAAAAHVNESSTSREQAAGEPAGAGSSSGRFFSAAGLSNLEQME